MNNLGQNNNLKNLLKKSDNKSLDDFEKEALEGFESLNSEQEALDLKAELDEKIRSELFFDKRPAAKTYWLAAAALFLAVGLSVIFLMNNGVVENKKDIALVQSSADTEKPDGLKEQAVATPAKTTNEPTSPAEEKETEKAPINKNNQESKSKISLLDAVTTNRKSSGEGAAQSASDSKGDELGNISAGGKKQNQPDLVFAEKSDEKNSNKNQADDSDKMGAVTNTPKDEKSKDLESLAQNKPAVAEELKKESKPGRAKSKRKESDQQPIADIATKTAVDEESESTEYVQGSTKGVLREDDNKKDAAKTSPATPSAVSGNDKNNNAGPANNISQNCYYSGGETGLIKDLREKLVEKNINKKFDAVLFINTNKEVEKVKFTATYDLNKDDESHIKEILKMLNKFNFTSTPTKTTEYKLIYRP